MKSVKFQITAVTQRIHCLRPNVKEAPWDDICYGLRIRVYKPVRAAVFIHVYETINLDMLIPKEIY